MYPTSGSGELVGKPVRPQALGSFSSRASCPGVGSANTLKLLSEPRAKLVTLFPSFLDTHHNICSLSSADQVLGPGLIPFSLTPESPLKVLKGNAAFNQAEFAVSTTIFLMPYKHLQV